MIKPRIIPCLLLDDQDLVKTIKFSKKKIHWRSFKYVKNI